MFERLLIASVDVARSPHNRGLTERDGRLVEAAARFVGHPLVTRRDASAVGHRAA
jgi:hypothetical protein